MLRSYLLIALVLPGSVGAQTSLASPEIPRAAPDSSEIIDDARAAQARFERRRVRYLPLTLESFGGDCDERVGRFCSWYDEGDWVPTPERPEIDELRTELLAFFDSAQTLLPGDGWLLGQRVWYRAERGDWLDAISTARRCGGVETWWCRALQGFALHGAGAVLDAERAFEDALEGMDPEDAWEWRIPRRAVDSDARDLLNDLDELPPDSAQRVLDRLWVLADPLYLVAGNDRRTAHYARWTVAELRRRARNPFLIAWGRDLEELTVRHGWEVGWERSPGSGFTSTENAIGHKHPEGRDFMPSGRALADPAVAPPEDLRADRTRPRSLYAPDYAPLFLPMEGQLAVFPRGDRMAVVATYFLPPDTSWHRGHAHPRPFLEAGDQAGLPDQAGLFLIPADGGSPRGVRTRGRTDGALLLEAPTGPWLASVELWSPERRRAGRFRRGLQRAAVPPDIAGLSDLLLLTPTDPEPVTLEAALASALPKAEIHPVQNFAIGWEVAGLGFRPETLRYHVSVEKLDRGVVRRIGEFLRLADRPRPIEISWEEPGPDEPGNVFRTLDLDLPDLEPGRYRITLEMATSGRGAARTSLELEVVG